ncbi:kelch repeat-containing protein [Vitiosangium sp. GDMCC 1.1324]|uniref:kelch repeat-containing protein n=1 Tax=Vitiosangium sp. (strain GDMCC 1.1324) TaxID=2138576 RepID=UPI001E38D1F6|nr:kelch repeat-containing protein [Vitiosangium sp. GDMCC 1.1324]
MSIWSLLPLVWVWLGCGVPGGKDARALHEDGRAAVTQGRRRAPLAAGPVSTLRSYHEFHTATLLPSGKVLVAGGPDTSAEEFDPATGIWSSTGPMVDARYTATATLLPSGKVLVTGDFLDPSGYLTSEVYDPATRTWGMTSAMKNGRSLHTATLLRSGRVLVVSQGEAEEYNPATNSWRATRAMATERLEHAATLLPSGEVLITGGYAVDHPVASAEIYDPVTGTWRTTASMHQARRNHTATLLPSGQVLVTGGEGPDGGALTSAELYDPATGTWSETGALATARIQHTATLLPSGRVLVAGGGPGGAPSRVEVYDPVTGTWSETAPLLMSGLALHTATLLPSGNVLIVHGQQAEVYTPPATSTWNPVAVPALAHRGHTATLLPSGQVLVAAGEGTARAELYDPATNTWRETGALAHARSGHTVTLLLSGRVLAAGGGTASAEVYDPDTGTWSETGAMATSRSGHTATLLRSGRVLVVSGAQAEEYEPGTGTWSETGRLVTAHTGHTATLLSSGKVLVAGGGTARAELYDPAARTWSTTTEMSQARAHHTATLLPSGQVLVTGGQGDAADNLSSAEVYDPDTGTWSATGAMKTSRSGHTATLLPSGQVLAAGGVGGEAVTEVYDPATGLWSETGILPDARSGHTTTLLPTGQALGVGGTSALTASHAVLYSEPRVLAAWRPAVDALTVKKPGSVLRLTGRGFQGLSEASGGVTQGSATNYPLVTLRALEGDTLVRLPGSDFSGSAVSVSLPAVRDGYYLLSVMVNGIPGGQLLRVDGTAPAPPQVTAPGRGTWLNNSRPTFSGTAEPGSSVRLALSGGGTWTLTADVRGAWSYTPDTALAEGPYTASLTAVDEAGNESPASEALGFTVDTRAPEAPEVTAPGDGITFYSHRTPDILGRAEPESTVRLSLDAGEAVTLKADGAGFWSFTPPQPLALGLHGVSVTATDRAGNTSAPATSSFTLATPGSYFGFNCASAPASPLLWAWGLVACWLTREGARRNRAPPGPSARGAGGPHRR